MRRPAVIWSSGRAPVPDQALAAGLAQWLVPVPTGGWTADEPVTISTCTDKSGNRLHILHNWSWRESTASASVTVTDLLGGESLAPGERVVLLPWDVRIFRG